MEDIKIISYIVFSFIVVVGMVNFIMWLIKKIIKTEKEYFCENCGYSEEVGSEKQAGRTVERARACSHDVED